MIFLMGSEYKSTNTHGFHDDSSIGIPSCCETLINGLYRYELASIVPHDVAAHP